MSSVASKNLFDLLGNDPDLDPDREPEPPTQAVDKPVQRSGKRNAGAEAPAAGESRSGGGGRRGGRHEVFSGSENGNVNESAAVRDNEAGSLNNRNKPVDDGLRQDRHPDRLGGARWKNDPGNPGRGRGGRGRGGRAAQDDRHSRTGFAPNQHAKQAALAWGDTTGTSEWDDEKAAEAIAKEDEKEGFDAVVDPPVNAEGEHPPEEVPVALADLAEPEDKSKSYADYLAEQAAKKLNLGGTPEARKPNEGGSKKFPEGKPLAKDEKEDFIAGSGSKAKRDRERKQKTFLDIDVTKEERPRESFRGGRGGPRGGRGEGGFRGEGRGRGGRGRGEGRGEGRGDFRGEGRGDFRGDFRGGFRGGRGGAPNSPNVADESAFPSLGGK